MNSEVAGSILTVFPRQSLGREKKKKKRGFSHVQEPVKLNHLKNNDESKNVYDRIIASHSNPEKVALDTGYLIGVPDIIWEICQV